MDWSRAVGWGSCQCQLQTSGADGGHYEKEHFPVLCLWKTLPRRYYTVKLSKKLVLTPKQLLSSMIFLLPKPVYIETL